MAKVVAIPSGGVLAMALNKVGQNSNTGIWATAFFLKNYALLRVTKPTYNLYTHMDLDTNYE